MFSRYRRSDVDEWTEYIWSVDVEDVSEKVGWTEEFGVWPDLKGVEGRSSGRWTRVPAERGRSSEGVEEKGNLLREKGPVKNIRMLHESEATGSFCFPRGNRVQEEFSEGSEDGKYLFVEPS